MTRRGRRCQWPTEPRSLRRVVPAERGARLGSRFARASVVNAGATSRARDPGRRRLAGLRPEEWPSKLSVGGRRTIRRPEATPHVGARRRLSQARTPSSLIAPVNCPGLDWVKSKMSACRAFRRSPSRQKAVRASRWLAAGRNRLRGALRLADAAIDALVRMDDQHVFAFVEAVHRTDLHAVHVLAADAVSVTTYVIVTSARLLSS